MQNTVLFPARVSTSDLMYIDEYRLPSGQVMRRFFQLIDGTVTVSAPEAVSRRKRTAAELSLFYATSHGGVQLGQANAQAFYEALKAHGDQKAIARFVRLVKAQVRA